MKKITFIAIAFLSLSACNNNSDIKNEKATGSATSQTNNYMPPAGVDSKVTASLKGIIVNYLKLKNALVADNGKEAADAATGILKASNQVDTTAMTTAQRNKYTDIAGDIKENAEHISENVGKLEHQREHFQILSKDVYDLVKLFGGGHQLYQDFCPMANDGKGATWLSEDKDIQNPYMGSKMPHCGEIKETLK